MISHTRAKGYKSINERLPSAERLHAMLEIRDGSRLFWRSRTAADFPGKRPWFWKIWNAMYAGQEAFYTIRQGYKSGYLERRHVKLHRVLFKMLHGYEPVEIDHIDGDKLNNDPSNLRASTPSLNQRNRKRRSDNKSGVNGVYWDRFKRKWCAKADLDGRVKFIGRYKTIEEAAQSRRKFDTANGFSQRHGT